MTATNRDSTPPDDGETRELIRSAFEREPFDLDDAPVPSTATETSLEEQVAKRVARGGILRKSPTEIASGVIALVRAEVAREIEADRACHQELTICPGCQAARIARGESR